MTSISTSHILEGHYLCNHRRDMLGWVEGVLLKIKFLHQISQVPKAFISRKCMYSDCIGSSLSFPPSFSSNSYSLLTHHLPSVG